MIRLVVDSTCDMPKRLIEKYNIAVLPLQVVLRDRSLRDGCDITLEQLYEVMRQGVLPKTAQISISETDGLFDDICRAGDDLIYLSFSSGMSGTYQAAVMVADELRPKYPERRIEIVDSQGGCIATGLVALQTARWIAAGMEYDKVFSQTLAMIDQVQHLFTLDSLHWLAKGGRLMRPVGYVGDKLQIKPILDVENATMHIVKVVRGRKHTITALVQMLQERIKGFPNQLIGIAHADDPEAAGQIEQMIREILPSAKTLILPIGCVLASHLGIGGVGLFFFKSPVPGYDLLSEPQI